MNSKRMCNFHLLYFAVGITLFFVTNAAAQKCTAYTGSEEKVAVACSQNTVEGATILLDTYRFNSGSCTCQFNTTADYLFITNLESPPVMQCDSRIDIQIGRTMSMTGESRRIACVTPRADLDTSEFRTGSVTIKQLYPDMRDASYCIRFQSSGAGKLTMECTSSGDSTSTTTTTTTVMSISTGSTTEKTSPTIPGSALADTTTMASNESLNNMVNVEWTGSETTGNETFIDETGYPVFNQETTTAEKPTTSDGLSETLLGNQTNLSDILIEPVITDKPPSIDLTETSISGNEILEITPSIENIQTQTTILEILEKTSSSSVKDPLFESSTNGNVMMDTSFKPLEAEMTTSSNDVFTQEVSTTTMAPDPSILLTPVSSISGLDTNMLSNGISTSSEYKIPSVSDYLINEISSTPVSSSLFTGDANSINVASSSGTINRKVLESSVATYHMKMTTESEAEISEPISIKPSTYDTETMSVYFPDKEAQLRSDEVSQILSSSIPRSSNKLGTSAGYLEQEAPVSKFLMNGIHVEVTTIRAAISPSATMTSFETKTSHLIDATVTTGFAGVSEYLGTSSLSDSFSADNSSYLKETIMPTTTQNLPVTEIYESELIQPNVLLPEFSRTLPTETLSSIQPTQSLVASNSIVTNELQVTQMTDATSNSIADTLSTGITTVPINEATQSAVLATESLQGTQTMEAQDLASQGTLTESITTSTEGTQTAEWSFVPTWKPDSPSSTGITLSTEATSMSKQSTQSTVSTSEATQRIPTTESNGFNVPKFTESNTLSTKESTTVLTQGMQTTELTTLSTQDAQSTNSSHLTTERTTTYKSTSNDSQSGMQTTEPIILSAEGLQTTETTALLKRQPTATLSTGDQTTESTTVSTQGAQTTESTTVSTQGTQYTESTTVSTQGTQSTESTTVSTQGAQTTESTTISTQGAQTTESTTLSIQGAQNMDSTLSTQGSQSAESRSLSTQGTQTTESTTVSTQGTQTTESTTTSTQGEQTTESTTVSTQGAQNMDSKTLSTQETQHTKSTTLSTQGIQATETTTLSTQAAQTTESRILSTQETQSTESTTFEPTIQTTQTTESTTLSKQGLQSTESINLSTERLMAAVSTETQTTESTTLTTQKTTASTQPTSSTMTLRTGSTTGVASESTPLFIDGLIIDGTEVESLPTTTSTERTTDVSDKKTTEIPSTIENIETKETTKILTTIVNIETKETTKIPTPIVNIENKETTKIPTTIENIETKETTKIPTTIVNIENKETTKIPTTIVNIENKETTKIPTTIENIETKETTKIPTTIVNIETKETTKIPTTIVNIENKETTKIPTTIVNIENKETTKIPTTIVNIENKETTKIPTTIVNIENKETTKIPTTIENIETKETTTETPIVPPIVVVNSEETTTTTTSPPPPPPPELSPTVTRENAAGIRTTAKPLGITTVRVPPVVPVEDTIAEIIEKATTGPTRQPNTVLPRETMLRENNSTSIDDSEQLDSDTITVIVVGSVIGIVVFIALIVILTTFLKSRRNSNALDHPEKAGMEMNGATKGIDNPLMQLEQEVQETSQSTPPVQHTLTNGKSNGHTEPALINEATENKNSDKIEVNMNPDVSKQDSNDSIVAKDEK